MRATAILLLTLYAMLGSGCTHESAPSAPVSSTTVKDAAMSAQHRSRSGYDITPFTRARVATIAATLDPEVYRITQKAGTEPPGCGTLLDNKKPGTYVCVVCGLPLFSSEHKFESGSGWPSFYAPVDAEHVATQVDNSLGMERVEIECARCKAHLGHVFDDGPKPTGKRHCLNSASLVFYDAGTLPPDAYTQDPTGLACGEANANPAATQEIAYFAGGCFWGVEHWFDECPGVLSADSGYMGGSTAKPDYKSVCTGTTNHAETVKVVFDPRKISYAQLLQAFFLMHDPTELNRQGPDEGTQYRSAIFCSNDAQLAAAKAAVEQLSKSGQYRGRKIHTEISKGGEFFPAETYHQDYLVKNPGRTCHVVNPWPIVLGADWKPKSQAPASIGSKGQ